MNADSLRLAYGIHVTPYHHDHGPGHHHAASHPEQSRHVPGTLHTAGSADRPDPRPRVARLESS